MLSLIDNKFVHPRGYEILFEPLETTLMGRLWRVKFCDQTCLVDLPSWERGLIRHRGAIYAAANQAILKADRVEAQKNGFGSTLRQITPDKLGPYDYDYLSGMDILSTVIRESVTQAFDLGDSGGWSPQPSRIREAILKLMRNSTTLLQINRESQVGQFERVVMFQDRSQIGEWMRRTRNNTFHRSLDFLGLIDFLATQNEDAMFKGYLCEGVTISNGCLLVNSDRSAPRSLMIGLSWKTPLGDSMTPTRSLISRGNRTEAVLPKHLQRPIVDWHPNPHAIEFSEGNPMDQKPSENMLYGLNPMVALVTWPGWLYKDAILVSESFANRAIHEVRVSQIFWTEEKVDWVKRIQVDDGSCPTRGWIHAGEVIAADGTKLITATDKLKTAAKIDPSQVRSIPSLVEDENRPVLRFFLRHNESETLDSRREVQLEERTLTGRQFLASRGILDAPELEGRWELRKVGIDEEILDEDRPLAGVRHLIAKPVKIMYRHSLVYMMECPLVTGAKIASRQAYKGVIRVVEDRLMPEGIDMLIAQENVPSRNIAACLLGEMALGAKALAHGNTCRAGRAVHPQQIIEVAAEYATPRTVEFPSWIATFTDSQSPEKKIRGRLSMNIGFGNYWVQDESKSNQFYKLHHNEFISLNQGEPIRVKAVVGPVFMMVMDRHPIITASICHEPSRNECGFVRKGDGAVVIGLNEVQTLRSLGLSETAEYLGWHDPIAVSAARELLEIVAGAAFPKNGTTGLEEIMKEIRQVLQQAGFVDHQIDDIATGILETFTNGSNTYLKNMGVAQSEPIVENLVKAIAGLAHSRYCRVRNSAPSHWKVVGLLTSTASLAMQQEAVTAIETGELGSWQIISQVEVEDSAGIVRVTLRNGECEVILDKMLDQIYTPPVPV